MLLSSCKLGLVIIFFIKITDVVLCYLSQINYTVVCPDIDPLTCAAADFFQQLGTGESTSLSIVKEVMLKHDWNWFLLKNVSSGTKF